MIDKKIEERLTVMFPNHPGFIKDYKEGKIYLYDSSLFNNEDENLNKGIYDQGYK